MGGTFILSAFERSWCSESSERGKLFAFCAVFCVLYGKRFFKLRVLDSELFSSGVILEQFGSFIVFLRFGTVGEWGSCCLLGV